jgi:hypothetical protein
MDMAESWTWLNASLLVWLKLWLKKRAAAVFRVLQLVANS